MNITLTGNLGSGKTSVCKELEKLGYKIISTGSIFREIADEKGISVIEMNELAANDRSIDDLIDQRTIQLSKEYDNAIFDSRLAWHFIPDSFKVFLSVDVKEAGRRVFAGDSRNAEEYESEQDTVNGLIKRANLEKERFLELYKIDYYNPSNYDLVIDTTNMTPREAAETIIKNFEEYNIKFRETELIIYI